MSRKEDEFDLDSTLKAFKSNLSRDAKSFKDLDRYLFSKYSIFKNDANSFLRLHSSIFDMPRKMGLENKLVIETVCGDFDRTVQTRNNSKPLNYTTTFLCSGSLCLPEREDFPERKNQIIVVSSFSKSNNFDDTSIYSDLVGLLYEFNPNVIIDLFRYDVTTRGTQRQAEPPVRFHQGQILHTQPLSRPGF